MSRPELVIGTSAPSTALEVVEDAYARGGSDASTNFGSASELVSKFSATAVYAREAFLKLDISGPEAATRCASGGTGGCPTRVHQASRHRSIPSQIRAGTKKPTWNNSRTLAGAMLFRNRSGTSSQWYEADITQYVQAQKAAGATLIAIALKNPIDTPPYASFGSRESANGPQLVIED